MSDIQDIEKAVRGLPQAELAQFRAWFAGFDAEGWDRQLEDDVNAGRLDALAQALAEHQAGKTSPRRDDVR